MAQKNPLTHSTFTQIKKYSSKCRNFLSRFRKCNPHRCVIYSFLSVWHRPPLVSTPPIEIQWESFPKSELEILNYTFSNRCPLLNHLQYKHETWQRSVPDLSSAQRGLCPFRNILIKNSFNTQISFPFWIKRCKNEIDKRFYASYEHLFWTRFLKK